jgi:hypothetical protein
LRQRQALAGITDTVTLGIAVRRFNNDVAAYNRLVAKVNDMTGRYNSLVEVDRYVSSHQTARPQIYRKLRAVSP